MNTPHFKGVPFIVYFLVLMYSQVQAVNAPAGNPDSTDIFTYVQQEYGSDQVLMNGFYPEDYVMDALGHPFLMDKIFYPGYIVLHDQKFNGVFLKYNIFDQNVIVSQTGTEDASLQVIPPNKFISEFKIGDKVFRKMAMDSAGERFFQVVYDGKMKCLFSFSKLRYESYHVNKNSSFKFTKEHKKSWLLTDRGFFRFNSLRSFLKYFPSNAKSGIKDFCRREKLKLSKSSDQQMAKLMEFVEDINQAE
jgi:hypothetical protein